MRILITGGTGFIGNAVFHALVTEHEITIGSRRPVEGYARWKQIDFTKENNWEQILADIDLVVNAVGIIEGDFDLVQTQSPLKLFEACVKLNICIINISAVGAEREDVSLPFLKSKKITDDFLFERAAARVVYPGIVLGMNGKSTRFFAEIAGLPVIPVVRAGIPPFIHIVQLAALIKDIVNNFGSYPKKVFAVSKPESLESVLSAIRGKKAVFLHVPVFLFNIFFQIFPRASIGIFNKNMLLMLSSISADDYAPLFEKASSEIDGKNLQKSNYLPELFSILAVFFVWTWSGISSVISWSESEALMHEIGASGHLAAAGIYLGSLIDIFLGTAIFWRKRRRTVLILQIIFVLTYTLILSILAPHYWLHPFGVLSKNIPLVALSIYLMRLKEE